MERELQRRPLEQTKQGRRVQLSQMAMPLRWKVDLFKLDLILQLGLREVLILLKDTG